MSGGVGGLAGAIPSARPDRRLPISPAIATRAVDLHEHHTDPQDRIIIASAIEHNARLMSDDSKFAKYVELEGCLL